MTVLAENNGRVELHSHTTLVCEVEIITEVDVPVSVEIEWDLPPLLTDENTASISETSGSGFSYSSTLTISNFTVRESGDYSCTGSVTPVHSELGSGGASGKTVSTTETIALRTGRVPEK